MPVTAGNITFTAPAFRTSKKASWVASSAGFLTRGATIADDRYLRTAARSLLLVHPRPAAELTFTSLWNKWVTTAPWKAYPSAIGGSWPYIWELVGAPSGMTIANPTHTDNSTYDLRAGHGRITWPSPTAGTHTFIVRCTDQEGAMVSRSVTLDVADSNGIWVDDALGTDSTAAAGTAAAPFKRIANFYGGLGGTGVAGDSSDTTYANKIVFFRAGTYTVPQDESLANLNLGSNKPCTWVAANDATVVLDCATSGIRVAPSNGAGTNNRIELIGLTTLNQDATKANTFQVYVATEPDSVSSSVVSSHVIVCDHIVDSWTHQGTAGSDNPAALRLSATDPGSNVFRKRNQVRNLRIRNVGGTTNSSNASVFIPMSTMESEYNNITFESQAAAVNVMVKFKHHFHDVTLRNSHIVTTVGSNEALSMQGGGGVSGTGATIEVEYCCIAMPTGTSLGIASGTGTEGDYGTTYVRRTTMFGTPPEALDFDTTVGTNAIVRGANIIEASASWQDHADWTGRVTTESSEVHATSGLVDASGLLEGANRTSHLGRKGWELAA